MNDSTDTPQIAHLRDLEAKRTAAFDGGMTERQLIAAFYEMTQTHPQWSRITPPIRSNQPEAGTTGYEPHSPAPVAWHERVDWPELLGTICGVLIVVAIAGACCWAAARAMGMTR